MDRKGQAGTLVIIIIAILIFWLIGIGLRECNNNGDCGEYQYCGSDHSCHPFEVKVNKVQKENFLLPATIIAVMIMGTAIFLKRNQAQP